MSGGLRRIATTGIRKGYTLLMDHHANSLRVFKPAHPVPMSFATAAGDRYRRNPGRLARR